MKLLAYSMRDTKADTFHAPFFVPNETAALRFLPVLLSNRESDMGRYPQDFQLYRIGALDTETGALTPELPTVICSAVSALPKPDPRQIMIPGTSQTLAQEPA